MRQAYCLQSLMQMISREMYQPGIPRGSCDLIFNTAEIIQIIQIPLGARGVQHLCNLNSCWVCSSSTATRRGKPCSYTQAKENNLFSCLVHSSKEKDQCMMVSLMWNPLGLPEEKMTKDFDIPF